jgi:quinol monooxygenase YgiN
MDSRAVLEKGGDEKGTIHHEALHVAAPVADSRSYGKFTRSSNRNCRLTNRELTNNGGAMSQLQITASFTIHDGKLDEFKKAAEACMASVREKDTGTSQYDWFFNDDQSVCVVREAYASSEAVLGHIGNLGDLMGQLLGTADMDLEVFGDVSAELKEAAAGLSPRYYSLFQAI